MRKEYFCLSGVLLASSIPMFFKVCSSASQVLLRYFFPLKCWLLRLRWWLECRRYGTGCDGSIKRFSLDHLIEPVLYFDFDLTVLWVLLPSSRFQPSPLMHTLALIVSAATWVLSAVLGAVSQKVKWKWVCIWYEFRLFVLETVHQNSKHVIL